MAKIVFLGTAASIPSKDRDNTSFVFGFKKDLFLIDCPGSIVQKLIKAKFDFRKINNIILTHHHPDHIYGLFHLIHAQYKLVKNINIFTNRPTNFLVKKIVSLLKLNQKNYPKIIYKNVFRKQFFYYKNNLKLKAVLNKHMERSFGVRFIFKGRSLLYSSDTALSKNIIKEVSFCDYLIHDCTASSSFFKREPSLYKMHTDSLSLAKTFYPFNLKKIIPVHFLSLKKGEEKKIEKELRPLRNRLIIPKDFQAILLS